MGFRFSAEDKYDQLPESILCYMQNFVQNRIDGLEELEAFVAVSDFDGIRDYCHKQVGVAGSYYCYKLEEIIKYIQYHARKNDIGPIQDVIEDLRSYLEDLAKKV